MPKYRRKIGIVDAAQWFKEGDHPLVKLKPPVRIASRDNIFGRSFHIETVSGKANVYPGDWIVTRADGDSYPVNPNVFRSLYELMEGK